MNAQHHIEIFSAGCPACNEAISIVNQVAQSGCEIEVLDMNDKDVSERAQSLGIHRVPAVVIDGTLSGCCAVGPVDAEVIGRELAG